MQPPPVIAVTSGEPAGIGPDICLKLAGRESGARLLVLGDRDLLAARAERLGLSCAGLDILHVPLRRPATPGRLDAGNAAYVLEMLDRALAGCRSGGFAAMVTAPVHKGVINEAGIAFTGHTEYLAEKTGTPRVVMMLAGAGMRVALATTHLPLKDVPAAITQTELETTIRILHADLAGKFGIARPRILVAGLNPHAGEGGHMGREEIEIIAPAIQQAVADGIAASGPFGADTMFRKKGCDAFIVMLHDQGHIAAKLLAFNRTAGLSIGSPILFSSVAHGSAHDIAGKGVADPGAVIEAVTRLAKVGALEKATMG
jgi:4-hydroxythreonine-4-phosphate dehydrogenase